MNSSTSFDQRSFFARGSRTFYYASLLLPTEVRDDVSTLYAFVRVADNLVDEPPIVAENFRAFRDDWRQAEHAPGIGNPVIDAFVELSRRRGFLSEWTEDFLATMESDLYHRPFESMDDVLRYTWGAAEVIGLFLLKIFGISDEARPFACLLGRSFQFINMLRDVAEDAAKGRRYLPLAGSEMSRIGPPLTPAKGREFSAFLRLHIDTYRLWRADAAEGYRFLPPRVRLAVKTAADLYDWTADVLEADPLLVWKRKVKPSFPRIVFTVLVNLVQSER